MADEKEKQEKPKEEKQEEEKKTAEPSFIEAVERMEKANAERKEILEREEQLATKNLLNGRADAGQTTKEEKKVETPAEYKERVMKGNL